MCRKPAKKRKEKSNKRQRVGGKKKKKKKEKKKSRATWTSPRATAHGHFCPKMMSNFSLQFSLHFGENFLVGSERKQLGPTIYFSSSPPNQTHSKKFSFPFSL